MRKFLFKIVIMLCIVGSILELGNALYRKKHFTVDDIPNELQVVNFGSSHAFYGMSYETLEADGIKGFNFALSGQVPTYDLAILKQNLDRIQRGGVCFITVSWFSFVWDEENKDGFDAKNDRYYSLVDREDIKQYSFEKDLRFNLLPVIYEKDKLFMKAEESRTTLLIREERWYNSATDMDLSEHAKKAYQGQVLDWENVILVDEIEAVYEMIEMCKKKHITPILITFPFTREFNECADDNLNIVFYNIMEKIVNDTGVKWYNYSSDERFIDRRDLFMDSNHLNYKGAEYFTEIVKDELINVYIK